VGKIENLRREYLEKMKDEYFSSLKREGRIDLFETCNCAGRILHNNGGNYHEIVCITYDNMDNKFYIKYTSTCELVAEPDWEEATEEEIKENLERALRRAWDIRVGDC